MKIHHPFAILCILFSCCSVALRAQENCVNCTNASASGTNASAIGNGTTASGNNAFAGGYLSTAQGSNSFAFGYNSRASQSTTIALGNTAQATGTGSVAIGNYVKATAKNAFAIGGGTTASYPLTNSIANSIALGMNSNKPTLLITKALNNNYTGKVAIGPLTNPQTKLHVKADNNEDAGLFLEPSDKTTHKAFLQLYDNRHLLSVDKSGTFSISAGTGMVQLSGGSYHLGNSDEKKVRVYAGDRACLSYNANRTERETMRDGEGSAYAIEFREDELCFRTAERQQAQDASITNWKDVLLLDTQGRIGIGSMATCLQNQEDGRLVVQSPSQMDLQAPHVALHGKVGINTVNPVDDYALAVNGGIISTKVFIKEVNQWPDHVFSEDYSLRPLEELRTYLETHRHLPGVPSEEEVVRQGYDLHAMQVALLEKIEELTRYVLGLQEEIDSLKNEKDPNYKLVQFDFDKSGNRVSRNLLVQRVETPHEPGRQQLKPLADLFPNPTSGQFTLLRRDTGETAPLHALLRNENGLLLEEKEIHNPQTEFDLSGRAAGLYLLEISGPQGTECWKIVKQ